MIQRQVTHPHMGVPLELEVSLDHGLLRLTGRQVDISLPSILSFSTHPINLSLFPVSLNNTRLTWVIFYLRKHILPKLDGIIPPIQSVIPSLPIFLDIC